MIADNRSYCISPMLSIMHSFYTSADLEGSRPPVIILRITGCTSTPRRSSSAICLLKLNMHPFDVHTTYAVFLISAHLTSTLFFPLGLKTSANSNLWKNFRRAPSPELWPLKRCLAAKKLWVSTRHLDCIRFPDKIAPVLGELVFTWLCPWTHIDLRIEEGELHKISVSYNRLLGGLCLANNLSCGPLVSSCSFSLSFYYYR